MQRVTLVLLILLAFCHFEVSNSAAQNNKSTVIATFSILADVASRVGGDQVEVSSLIPTDSDPHTFEPTAKDVAALAEADVVLVNGAYLEEGLLKTIENASEDMHIVIVSQCVEIQAFGQADPSDEGRANNDDSAIATQCAAHYAELGIENPQGQRQALGQLYAIDCAGHDEGSAESCDPHVWTNPQNVMLWTLMIRDTLSALDPNHADLFAENAATYLSELETLEVEIQALVDTLPAEERVLVMNHDTLGYLADHYGFTIVGTVIPGGGTSAEPSAAELAQVIETIRDSGASAIFAENTVSQELAKQIADEAGAQVLTLYSDSLSDAEGDAPTYLDYMRYNVQTIVKGLNR